MYTQGDLEFKKVYDSRFDGSKTSFGEGDEDTWFCLPHSCDNWVIGGPVEARLLVDDLLKLLKEIES